MILKNVFTRLRKLINITHQLYGDKYFLEYGVLAYLVSAYPYETCSILELFCLFFKV